MGQKITKLEPIDGVCAEISAACSIFLATHLGVPVSTTHMITGAISGVGSAVRFSAVRWGGHSYCLGLGFGLHNSGHRCPGRPRLSAVCYYGRFGLKNTTL